LLWVLIDDPPLPSEKTALKIQLYPFFLVSSGWGECGWILGGKST